MHRQGAPPAQASQAALTTLLVEPGGDESGYNDHWGALCSMVLGLILRLAEGWWAGAGTCAIHHRSIEVAGSRRDVSSGGAGDAASAGGRNGSHGVKELLGGVWGQ